MCRCAAPPGRRVAPGSGSLIRVLGAVASLGCGGSPTGKPAGGGGAGGADGGDSGGPEAPVEVGGFALEGQLVDALGGDAAGVAGEWCVALADPTPLMSGLPPTELALTRSSADGRFRFDAVPRATSLGLLLMVDACGASGAAISPTAALLPAEAWATRGPDDPWTGVEAPALRADALARIDAEMAASGAVRLLGDWGGLMGTISDPELGPLEEGWVRGPTPVEGAWYAVWYDEGGGSWESFSGAYEDGGARYAIPEAPFGPWIAKAGTDDFPVILAGGLEGWVLVHHYQPR